MNKLAVLMPRTSILKNSFSYSGAVLWKSLPSELRQTESLHAGIFVGSSTRTTLFINFCILHILVVIFILGF